MAKKCALYNIETDLKESHIYPKFVIKHTKKTGDKYLRRPINPNKREQDGIKLYLLGEKAEQEFSKREKWFAENIFVPYLSGKSDLNYDENLFYFSISFLWRILILNIKKDPTINSQWYYKIILDVEQEWREYLTDGKIPPNYSDSNLFLTDRVIHNNDSTLKGVDFYMTRGFDSTIVDNKPGTILLIYGKFNRFVFWSVIKKYGGEDDLHDVKIAPNGGNLYSPQNLKYFPLISFIQNRIREISNYPLPNQNEQDKIEKEILKDPKKFWESDLGKSLFNDKFNLEK